MDTSEIKEKLTKLRRFKTFIFNHLDGASIDKLNAWKDRIVKAKHEAVDSWEIVFAGDINEDETAELNTLKETIDTVYKEAEDKLGAFMAFAVAKIAEADEKLENEKTERERQEKEKIEREKQEKERIEREKQENIEKQQQHTPPEVDILDSDDEEMSGVADTTAHQHYPVVQLKLDRIQLPTFAGDWIEWTGFKDLFDVLVHSNKYLSDTVKFHQLRNHLKGQAAETIRGYKVTEGNYQAAWSDLKNRYDRSDPIIDEYIRKFFEMPIIPTNPNGQKLQIVVDGTNQLLRALPTFKVDVSSWDPILKFIIVSKLDEKTRNDWKQLIGREEGVSVHRLLEFLETRAIQMQPLQGERLLQMLTISDKRRQNIPRKIFHVADQGNNNQKAENLNQGASTSFQQSRGANQGASTSFEQLKCAQCGGNHALYRCKDILKEKASDRTNIIRDKLHRCIKCLGQHERGQCEFKKCPYCGGPHNTLLCYQKEHDYIQQKRSEREGESSNVHTLSKN